MKKLQKIITIDTDKTYPETCLIKKGDKYHYCLAGGEFRRLVANGWQPQELILISNEEIKEGDLVLYEMNSIEYATIDYIEANSYNGKIIAAYPQIENLPLFSKEFLQEWCNNPVEKIGVQYDEISTKVNRNGLLIRYILNLTSNNEVICNLPQDFKSVKLLKEYLEETPKEELTKHWNDINKTRLYSEDDLLSLANYISDSNTFHYTIKSLVENWKNQK